MRRTAITAIRAEDRKTKKRIFSAALRLQMDKHGDTVIADGVNTAATALPHQPFFECPLLAAQSGH